MSGIVAFISSNPSHESRSLLASMVEAISQQAQHRARIYCFDELGIYVGLSEREDGVCVQEGQRDGLTRAPITVVMAGEPITTDLPEEVSTGRVAAELRIADAYVKAGCAIVGALNGEFAGAIVDTALRRLVVFNDRYGIQRLYWRSTPTGVFFASEAKALLAAFPECCAFDDEGVAQYLAFGCTLGERSLFRDVSILPGGSVWSVSAPNAVAKRRYHEPLVSSVDLSEAELEQALVETICQVLPEYAQSRGLPGLSLTAGLDTRLILAAASHLGIKTTSYTFSGTCEDTLDATIGASLARICGIEHQILRIDSTFLESFPELADETVIATDGTAGVLDSHELFLNRLARKVSPVRLTGNFGSEVLRGMSTFKPLKLQQDLMRKPLAARVAELERSGPERMAHPALFAAHVEVPNKIFGVPAAAKSQLRVRTPYMDNRIVELAARAQLTVRQSTAVFMRAVARLEPRIAGIPTDRGLRFGDNRIVSLVRHAAAQTGFKLDYFHKEGLPGVLSRFDPVFDGLKAMGAAGLHKYLSYRSWLMGPLAAWKVERVNAAAGQEFWDDEVLRSFVESQQGGKTIGVREINAIITLETVQRTLLCGRSRGRGSGERALLTAV